MSHIMHYACEGVTFPVAISMTHPTPQWSAHFLNVLALYLNIPTYYQIERLCFVRATVKDNIMWSFKFEWCIICALSYNYRVQQCQ